ncbi:LUD domain-containing protein [Halorubellus sp. JP-L1]|uniref:LUD domain-containing protein n=1 Tax=Halorubellus sp. JP-L1 TaxID=2715753 RepID=UPI0014077967|nr:LUD domain-containing protein [Halorubellus sp. JP-L1]NHN40927.1 LUD domain-containing protein [Halorubellus sp. JP-L1]
MTDSAIDHLDAFRTSLDDAGVTHETVGIDEATAAIERAIEPPAVGVALHVDVSLPAAVEREFAPAALQAARTGVTPGRLGVAETGSVLVRSTADADELVSLYPDRHVAVVRADDVVGDVSTATAWLDDEVAARVDADADGDDDATADGDDPDANAAGAGRDSHVVATGVSATADMGALVEGVHGPTEVHVVVIDS